MAYGNEYRAARDGRWIESCSRSRPAAAGRPMPCDAMRAWQAVVSGVLIASSLAARHPTTAPHPPSKRAGRTHVRMARQRLHAPRPKAKQARVTP